MLPQFFITVHRVLISDPVVQVGLDIVIRLVLRVGVGNINFITISIISLSVPASCIRSVDVVHVALLQVFAAGAGAGTCSNFLGGRWKGAALVAGRADASSAAFAAAAF